MKKKINIIPLQNKINTNLVNSNKYNLVLQRNIYKRIKYLIQEFIKESNNTICYYIKKLLKK